MPAGVTTSIGQTSNATSQLVCSDTHSLIIVRSPCPQPTERQAWRLRRPHASCRAPGAENGTGGKWTIYAGRLPPAALCPVPVVPGKPVPSAALAEAWRRLTAWRACARALGPPLCWRRSQPIFGEKCRPTIAVGRGCAPLNIAMPCNTAVCRLSVRAGVVGSAALARRPWHIHCRFRHAVQGRLARATSPPR